eukprot:TRINITY_DN4432_c0_g1_i1.p1 TRINITY_DN4432_c0_g1~~TRINITY_DN4432_c0_g1_i1.p1  ORF type:complete len:297 (+),score=40.20 TRINITY_DN4432_c0_g1_i1:16-906(+)
MLKLRYDVDPSSSQTAVLAHFEHLLFTLLGISIAWCGDMAEPGANGAFSVLKSFGSHILESTQSHIMSLYKTLIRITHTGIVPELPNDVLFEIMRRLDRRQEAKFGAANKTTLRIYRLRRHIELGPTVNVPSTMVSLGRIIEIGRTNKFRCHCCHKAVGTHTITHRKEIVLAVRRARSRLEKRRRIRLLCDTCHRDWKRLLKILCRQLWPNTSWKDSVLYSTGSNNERMDAIKMIVARKKRLDAFYGYEEKYLMFLLMHYPTALEPRNRPAPAKRDRDEQQQQPDNLEPAPKKPST